jgi:hypothetical protein
MAAHAAWRAWGGVVDTFKFRRVVRLHINVRPESTSWMCGERSHKRAAVGSRVALDNTAI